MLAVGYGLVAAGVEQLAMMRYDGSGAPEVGFDGDGVATVQTGLGTSDRAFAALLAEGSLVVAGSADDGPGFALAVAAFSGTTGTLDAAFSTEDLPDGITGDGDGVDILRLTVGGTFGARFGWACP